MAPSPIKRHTISSTSTNPLLSNFSMMSLEQQCTGGSSSQARIPPVSSKASPSKASKSHIRGTHHHSKSQGMAPSHPRVTRAISRDDVLGRDMVKRDWSSSPTKKASFSSASSRKVRVTSSFLPKSSYVTWLFEFQAFWSDSHTNLLDYSRL